MKKIVVTGATSFIGGYLLDELANSDCEIYALVRPDSKKKSNLKSKQNINIIEIALENIMDLKNYISNVDVCYHLAWDGTRVPERYYEELQKSNYEYSIETYEVLKSLGCKVFIGLGSQAEYGFCQDIITEDIVAVPNTAYGKWKLQTCLELMKLGNKDSIRVIWGRVFSIYGFGDYDNTLIMNSVRKMKNNEAIDMTAGTQYWNYLYVQDLIKLLIILEKAPNAHGIYNLASNDTRMLKDYIIELKNIIVSNSVLNFGSIPYRNKGIVNIYPSINKLQNEIKETFNYTTFHEGIIKLINKQCNQRRD